MEKEKWQVWVFRSVIGVLLAVTSYYTQGTYNDFQQLKQTVTEILIENAAKSSEIESAKESLQEVKEKLNDIKPCE